MFALYRLCDILSPTDFVFIINIAHLGFCYMEILHYNK